MTFPCSATVGLYSDRRCVGRLFLWYQRRGHWLYGTRPTVHLPPDMPLSSASAKVNPSATEIQNKMDPLLEAMYLTLLFPIYSALALMRNKAPPTETGRLPQLKTVQIRSP